MTPLSDLRKRVSEASGADRELDALIACVLDVRPEWVGADQVLVPTPSGLVRPDNRVHGSFSAGRFTSSLDAALALVERQKGSSIDAAQMLHQAVEDMANGGWRDDKPIGPQICLYLILAMLSALEGGE